MDGVTLKSNKETHTFVFKVIWNIAKPKKKDKTLKITLTNPGKRGKNEYSITLSFKVEEPLI
jgi:uncharacterized protein YjbK